MRRKRRKCGGKVRSKEEKMHGMEGSGERGREDKKMKGFRNRRDG